MPDFDVEIEHEIHKIEFEAWCAECGAGLCGNITDTSNFRRRLPSISIEPCQQCLERHYDAGWERGLQSANDEV